MKHRQEPAQVDPARVANEGGARNQDKRIEKREPKNDEGRRDPEPIEIGSRRRRSDGEVRHRLLLE
jgi:hypothetical protein